MRVVVGLAMAVCARHSCNFICRLRSETIAGLCGICARSHGNVERLLGGSEWTIVELVALVRAGTG